MRHNLGQLMRQSQDKVRTNEAFLTLVGLQRHITLFLYDCCKASRNKQTEPLSNFGIAESCKTTTQSARKTIQRLEMKGIISRAEYKDGRGGWTRYELPDFLFQEVLRIETGDKVGIGESQKKLP